MPSFFHYYWSYFVCTLDFWDLIKNGRIVDNNNTTNNNNNSSKLLPATIEARHHSKDGNKFEKINFRNEKKKIKLNIKWISRKKLSKKWLSNKMETKIHTKCIQFAAISRSLKDIGVMRYYFWLSAYYRNKNLFKLFWCENKPSNYRTWINLNSILDYNRLYV